MRAIDLYSGIGGWSVGLRSAGVQVIAAYEIWPPAVRTYNANLGTDHPSCDITTLDLATLPDDISMVVGSPPCTEFSYSNRGGGGDISEGLKGIVKFFEVVERLDPKYWIMENVPRTASVIREGFAAKDHPLYKFRRLAPEICLIDLSDLGLPQARTRCFVGRFPFARLRTLGLRQPKRDLGQVIEALSAADVVADPIWGIELRRSMLTEMEPEPALNPEQLRMNREAKRFHPVYNDMPFPDRLDRPSRTVTATCTRVSRESIVIDDGRSSVRRLTVRERASLQGFPVTYQFYGNSHSQKVKLIGNAVPPLFALMVGTVAQNETVDALDMDAAAALLVEPSVLPKVTPPHAVGVSYPSMRRFRAALPGLRFKSGMRFQLANEGRDDTLSWRVAFFFGPSKDIRTVPLDDLLFATLTQHESIASAVAKCRRKMTTIRQTVNSCSPRGLQERWRHSADGTGPYHIADLLGQASIALASALATNLPLERLAKFALDACRAAIGATGSSRKITENAPSVLAGLLIGSWFNSLTWADETGCDQEAPELSQLLQ